MRFCCSLLFVPFCCTLANSVVAKQLAAPAAFCLAQNTPIAGLSGWGYDADANQLWFFFRTVGPARKVDISVRCTDQLFGLAGPYIADVQVTCRKQPDRIVLGVYVGGERLDIPVRDVISKQATSENVVTTIYNRAGATEWVPAGERPPDTYAKFVVRPRIEGLGQLPTHQCPIEELR